MTYYLVSTVNWVNWVDAAHTITINRDERHLVPFFLPPPTF